MVWSRGGRGEVVAPFVVTAFMRFWPSEPDESGYYEPLWLSRKRLFRLGLGRFFLEPGVFRSREDLVDYGAIIEAPCRDRRPS